MKRLLTLLLLLAPSVLAQNPVSGGPIPQATYTTPPVNANPTHGTGAPSGTCMSGIIYTNDSNGNVYACNAGTWTLTGNGGYPGCTSPGTGAITCTNNVLAANLPPALPTTPNGLPYFDVSTPAGGLGVPPVWAPAGVPGRSNAGATDAIVYTDRGAGVLETNGGAVAVSLPQAGTTNFGNNFDFFIKCATTTVCTITTAAGQIAGNNGTLAATLVMPASSTAYCYSFDNANYQCGVVSSGSAGTVTTTGSPASSYCAYFSGATSIIGTANCILDSSGNLFAGGYVSVAGNFLVGGNSGGSASTILMSNGGVIDIGSGGVIKMSTTSNVFAGTLKPLIVNTAPTISSGFGTGASVTANNGTAAFRIGVGTSNTGNGVIGLPTANTGWNCYATDITTKSTSVAETLQTGSTTTTATLQNYSNIIGTGAWVDNDVLAVSCFGY